MMRMGKIKGQFVWFTFQDAGKHLVKKGIGCGYIHMAVQSYLDFAVTNHIYLKGWTGHLR
jgi:hypothetical protein